MNCIFFTICVEIRHIVLYDISVIYNIYFISDNEITPHVLHIFILNSSMLKGSYWNNFGKQYEFSHFALYLNTTGATQEAVFLSVGP